MSTPATIKFHEKILRLAKGMINAYEEWIQDMKKDSVQAASQ